MKTYASDLKTKTKKKKNSLKREGDKLGIESVMLEIKAMKGMKKYWENQEKVSLRMSRLVDIMIEWHIPSADGQMAEGSSR